MERTMERTYSLPRNDVIEAALSVLESCDSSNVRYSFYPIDADTTQVVIVMHDAKLTERDRQRMCAWIFDEVEHRLLLRNQGTLGNNGGRSTTN